MVECQWDSVVPSPSSPELTGLGLPFMGLTGSKSGLFRAPGLLSYLWELRKKKEENKREGKKEKGHRKGMEGRMEKRNKKRLVERFEEGILTKIKISK